MISGHLYTEILKKSIENITSISDFVNGKITHDELHSNTSISFNDYLCNRQNVSYFLFRKKYIAVWCSLCLLRRLHACKYHKSLITLKILLKGQVDMQKEKISLKIIASR